MHLCFIAENASVQNEAKKKKHKILLTCILGLAGVICFKFIM